MKGMRFNDHSFYDVICAYTLYDSTILIPWDLSGFRVSWSLLSM